MILGWTHTPPDYGPRPPYQSSDDRDAMEFHCMDAQCIGITYHMSRSIVTYNEHSFFSLI